MAIKKVAEYEHGNADLAFVDSSFVRGGGRSVADLDALYALSTKSDQLKQNVSMVYVESEPSVFLLTDESNIGNASGWTDLSDVTGGGGPWVVSNNDIYNSNSGNVGIGTSTPSEKLHVAGNIFMSEGSKLMSETTDPTSGAQSQSLEFFLPYRSDGVTMAENRSALMLGGTKFFEPRTTNKSRLHVFGALDIVPTNSVGEGGSLSISFGSASDTYPSTVLSLGSWANFASTTDRHINNYGYLGVRFEANGARFDVDGASLGEFNTTGLGIGTNSPTAKLDVYGGESRFGTDQLGYVQILGNGGGGVVKSNKRLYLETFGGYDMDLKSTGNYNFKNNATTTYVHFDGTNERVGIGTTSPNKQLTLHQGVNNLYTALDSRGIYFSRSSIGDYAGSIVADNGGNPAYSARNYHRFYVVGQQTFAVGENANISGNGAVAIGSDVNNTHLKQSVLSVGGGVAIGSSTTFNRNAATSDGLLVEGNVGIGTTTPEAKLDVAGNVGNTPFYLIKSFYKSSTVNWHGGLQLGWGKDDGSDPFRFEIGGYNSGSNRLIRLHFSNTTGAQFSGAPYFKFSSEIEPLSAISGGIVTPFHKNGYFRIKNNSGTTFPVTSWIFMSEGGPTYSPGEIMRIGGDGKVGIGTTSPSAKLDVVGLANINDGSNNVMISSDNSTITASNTTAVGYQALTALTTGTDNLAIGANALDSLETGSRNLAIGYQALDANVSGSNNIAIGYGAQRWKTNKTQNVSIGVSTLSNNTQGDKNVAIGNYAGQNTNGNSNVYVGHQAGLSNSTNSASNNVGVGEQSIYSLASGSNNVALGHNAGYSIVNGSSNVFLGYQAGYSETGSNKLYIANSTTSTPLIYGEFDNDLVKVYGDFTVSNGVHDLFHVDSVITGTIFSVNDVSGLPKLTVTDLGEITINDAFTLPTTDGTSGQVLSTDGSGTVSWATVSGSGVDTNLATSNLTQSAADRTYTLYGNASSSLSIKSGENKNVFSFEDAGSVGTHTPQSTAFGTLFINESDTNANDSKIVIRSTGSTVTTTIPGNMGTVDGETVANDEATQAFRFLVKDTSDSGTVKEMTFIEMIRALLYSGINNYADTTGSNIEQFQSGGLTGDFNGDGEVGVADLLTFLGQFGQSLLDEGFYLPRQINIENAPNTSISDSPTVLDFESAQTTVSVEGTIFTEIDYTNNKITFRDEGLFILSAYPNKKIRISGWSNSSKQFGFTATTEGENVFFYIKISVYDSSGSLLGEGLYLHSQGPSDPGSEVEVGQGEIQNYPVSDIYEQEADISKIEVSFYAETQYGTEVEAKIKDLEIKLL